MKLEFGKYTDVTKLAKKVNPDFLVDYLKVYICPDTRNWWVSCVQKRKDMNEDYEREEGKYLIERCLVEYDTSRLCNVYLDEAYVRQVLKDCNGEFLDNYECDSFEEVIEVIDAGYGINEEE